MVKHTKPTNEELEAGIKNTQAELEKLEDKEVKKVEAEPVVEEKSEEVESTETEEVESTTEETNEESIEEVDTTEKEEVKEETKEEDYKKKFSESSREAQKIHAKNRKLNEAIAEAGGIPEPTVEEMTAEYKDWDVMSETEQKLAKESYINKKRFDIIHKATEETKKYEKWGEDVEKFVEDPKTLVSHPELEGKEDDFKYFANKLENNAIPFKILVSAFLHEQSKMVKPKKGKMFETGTGGPNSKVKMKADKLSVMEASALMKTNYKKYTEYLKAGKIENL